jgi:hypothetical protein
MTKGIKERKIEKEKERKREGENERKEDRNITKTDF